jgi:lysophospholipase L1-like esterase
MVMRVFRTEIRVIQISLVVSVVIFTLAAIFWTKGEIGPVPENGNTVVTPPPENKVTVVCIGDSYTYGYPVRQAEDASWPKYMEGFLGDGVNVINEGKTGGNISEKLVEQFETEVERQSPKMVIIFAGMGDALRDPPVDALTFQGNIDTLVQTAQIKGIIPVLVMPFAYPDEEKQKLITQYREWLTTYAQSHSVLLVDFQGFLCDEQGIKRQYTGSSGKYPNADGYKEMGKYMAEQIRDKVVSG